MLIYNTIYLHNMNILQDRISNPVCLHSTNNYAALYVSNFNTFRSGNKSWLYCIVFINFHITSTLITSTLIPVGFNFCQAWQASQPGAEKLALLSHSCADTTTWLYTSRRGSWVYSDQDHPEIPTTQIIILRLLNNPTQQTIIIIQQNCMLMKL